MLMTQYNFTVTESPRNGVDIVLTSNDGTKTKTFFVAGGSIEAFTKFMSHLTDENCDGFFPQRRQKK